MMLGGRVLSIVRSTHTDKETGRGGTIVLNANWLYLIFKKPIFYLLLNSRWQQLFPFMKNLIEKRIKPTFSVITFEPQLVQKHLGVLRKNFTFLGQGIIWWQKNLLIFFAT